MFSDKNAMYLASHTMRMYLAYTQCVRWICNFVIHNGSYNDEFIEASCISVWSTVEFKTRMDKNTCIMNRSLLVLKTSNDEYIQCHICKVVLLNLLPTVAVTFALTRTVFSLPPYRQQNDIEDWRLTDNDWLHTKVLAHLELIVNHCDVTAN